MDGWSHQRQVEPTWSSRFPAAMRSSFITSRIPTIPPGLAGGPLTLLFNGFLPFRQTTILYSFFSNARESLLFLSLVNPPFSNSKDEAFTLFSRSDISINRKSSRTSLSVAALLCFEAKKEVTCSASAVLDFFFVLVLGLIPPRFASLRSFRRSYLDLFLCLLSYVFLPTRFALLPPQT